jgi:hypothetical protein
MAKAEKLVQIKLHVFFPHLCNKEMRKLRDYMLRILPEAKVGETRTVIVYPKQTEIDEKVLFARMLGFVDGSASRLYWGDEDADEWGEEE